MACLICGGKNAQQLVCEYKKPDKYEQWMGITDVHRTWWACKNCGHYHQTRNYDLKQLEGIYKKGYRDKEFRGESISQAFDRITKIPWNESENKQRVDWFTTRTHTESTIDIGSGIGVFPYLLKDFGYPVECVEENEESIKFLDGKGFICWNEIPDMPYWNVSLLHVLEHIEDPDLFLSRIKKICRRHLFIEVPDAREFEMLPIDNDEFNSCHLWFFTLQNLITLIERNGFTVRDTARQFYRQRKLSRILVMATA